MDLNLLRILSGRHAGARVPLAPGVLRLGPEEGSDVVVTDWTFAPLDLRVGSEGVTAEWTVADGSGLQRRRLLDRQAAEFDGSVICVGPAEGDWPDDAALLAAVFEPPSQASAASSARLRRRTPLLAGLGACVALALVAALWATYPHQPAPTLEATRALVQRTVDRIAPQRLQVLSEGNALVITGMLDAVGQADAVRAAVEGARGAFAAMPRFSVASQVAESIR